MRSGILFALIILLTSCVSEQNIKITATINGKPYEQILQSNTDELKIGRFGFFIQDLKNIEKLKNLKVLYISLGGDPLDLSFLNSLNNIEYLFTGGCTNKDFNFVKKMPKLKVLYFSGFTITNSVLDLSNNSQLEYLNLNNMFSAKYPDALFDLDVINMPQTLKYVELTHNIHINVDLKFIDALSNAKTIVFDQDMYEAHKEYFTKHPNFVFEDAKHRGVYIPLELKNSKEFLEPPKYTIP
jgi:hypothetical protein